MTCEQAELRMAELLAGEISPEDRSQLEKHLLDCAACRGDYELARAGARIEWADVAVPKEVIEATLASFREPTRTVRLLRWATAAAAVFGLAALLIASSRAPKTEAPATPVAATRPAMLATMQDPAVGAMVCKDEEGRPVGELGLKSHDVRVEILDGIAKTTVEENFENHTSRRLEGTFNFPLPSDASISRLALEVNGKIEEGTCLERERAREVFEGIVRRMQDPALLEWQPGGFFKCRVFPIEPRATKRVIIAYTQALPCFQGKMTYVYPLASEKTRTHAPEEVTIGVEACFSGALAKIESPSHHLEVQRKNANEAAMTFRAAHYRPNNDFVVTLEPGPEEVRVVSHKTDGEDGYFACFATPQGGGERQPGKYAFVLDASASISAPRLEVAKRLVRAMMERRIEGDRFEILAHHVEVERSGEVDLRAANTFMDRIQPIGGSDVLKALQAAGDAQVVYIGKGAPTFGETEPSKILEAVKGLRIRTIAVGSDANGALLERLGGMMRVNPNDDVAKRVSEIAATIGAPVLSDVKIEGGDAVYDVVGVRDLFYGERLVVSGRYRGPTSKLVITGRGYRREVDVAFPAKEEKNNYVRRLWAQRKVADLMAQGPVKKPEVTDLGVKYQIMTPYTSFLVLETEKMWQDHNLKREVQKQDEVLGKKVAEAEAGAHEVATKREVIRKIAHLLELSYAAAEQQKFDRVGKLCDQILMIDPNYPVAREMKEDAEKARHKENYWSVWSSKVVDLKRQTCDDEQPTLPKVTSLRCPSREEWGEISKRLSESVIKTEGGAADEPEPTVAAPVTRKAPPLKSEEPKPVAPVVVEPPPVRPVEPVKPEMKKIADNVRKGEEAPTPKPSPVTPTEPEKPKPIELSVAAADPTPKNPDTTTQSLVVQTTPRPVQPGLVGKLVPDQVVAGKLPPQLVQTITPNRTEDRSAKAIREAYEEQLLRDRQEWTINALTFEESKSRPGPGFSAQESVRQSMQDSWSSLGWDSSSFKDGRVTIDDWAGYAALPTEGGVLPGIFSLTTNVAAPGAPITDALETENSSKAARINDLQRKIESRITNGDRYEADMQVFVRQLEVDLAQLQELTTSVAEHRAKLSKQQPKGLAEMQEEVMLPKANSMIQAGGNVNVVPKKALEAKVTAVSTEIDLTVISIGKEDGVLEGDEFNVYRGGDFVAKIVIDRSDRKWSAGKTVLRKSTARIGDDVSNHIFVSGPREGGKEVVACTIPTLSMDVVTAASDGSWVGLKGVNADPNQFYAVTRAGKFVALVRVGRVNGTQIDARVWQNLSVGRILPGDRAVFVVDPMRYLAALPAEVRMDLSSRTSQVSIRAKMGLKE